MDKIVRGYYTGERALFASKGLHLCEATFADGESPLKESSNLVLDNCLFRWKYPLWYCHDITVNNCTLFDTARAGVWYTDNARFNNCVIEAPKTFRRATNLTLGNVQLPNASETLWNCSDVTLNGVSANGAYFGMNCKRVTAEDLTITGDYCFDGAEDVVLRRARLLSKDSFWNSKNVTIYDSFISGEYLAWNSENLTLVNCTIESLQALCYVRNLTMVNCVTLNTTRAFEYSSVDVQIRGEVGSIVNPSSGVIRADSVGQYVADGKFVDPARTRLLTGEDA